MEAMRTVYSLNSIPTPSSDVEMVVNAPKVKEITFTLITNKKGKEKAKLSSSSSTNSKNKIFLVSRASTVLKTVTASAASKPATIHSSSTAAAIIISKPAQPQNTPPIVPLAFKPKPKVKLLVQAVKANNIT